ncbi:SSI family serine proteinase inhibitor [Streptomyces sp. VMFN-G11Ma]|uniref:SSI family serine proteinase inhibitor n=1 Tax=Streptomyces sp. VMFN-G11Ma TaxID=2135609 RepID=UPI000D372773|nr:SSI family serine proteinase inhibitor [Streptomyces sp. VMFN-G11Ma]PTM95521.1 subtilisin inhibitor-like [Streptomyces sp. VMFN-G11Ma]
MLLARFLVAAATAATAATASTSVVPAAAHADPGRTPLAFDLGRTPLTDGPGRTPLAPPPVQQDDQAGGPRGAEAGGQPHAQPHDQTPTQPRDHLTVTVRHAGGGADGTYRLLCHPGGGTHPDADRACAALDRVTTWGKDTFAPVPGDSVCTMQYGGPATAHVTGVWAGRPVDAEYDRSNGCEIGRWDRLVPLLPDLGEQVGGQGWRP